MIARLLQVVGVHHKVKKKIKCYYLLFFLCFIKFFFSDSQTNYTYFIKRLANHLPPLFLERRRDELNPKTMDFEYVELVTLKNIYGDIFVKIK